MKEHTVSARFAYRIIRAAEERGARTGTLVAEADVCLPGEESSDARITADAYWRVWAAAMKQVNDPAFPIDVAAGVTAARHGVIGFAFMTAANLGEALERAIRYVAIFTDSARWHRTLEGENVRYTLERSGTSTSGVRDPRCQPADLFALAELVAGGRHVTGTTWAPMEVCLTQPEPQCTDRFREFFGAPLSYGHDRTSWLIDAAVLAQPLRKADPELLAYFDLQAELLLSRFDGADAVRQVRRLAMQALGGEMITLEKAAAAMGRSPRSLHRQLQDHGVTFTKIIDELRSSLAQDQLGDPRRTIGEVAFLLGYSEPSAFHRAFRRWTGLTPQAFRGQK